MQNILKSSVGGVLLLGITSIGQAQVLDGYAMYDPPKPPAATSTYVIDPNTAGADGVAATVGNPGTLASPLALGPGFNPDYNFRLGFNPSSNYATTVAGAKTNGDYLTFSIAPTVPDTAINLSGIDFSAIDFITANGPGTPNETFTLESSVNNFSSVLGSFTGSEFVNPIANSKLDLNLYLTGTTEFRLYITVPSGGVSGYPTYETGLYRGTLAIDGTVVPIPEPSTYALLGLGLCALVLVRGRASSKA